MKVVLNREALEQMHLFQKLTGATVIDSISEGEDIYFVVGEGQYGKAVGRGGMKIRNAEKTFRKAIKVLEFSKDPEEFIRNIIPEVQEIRVEGKSVLLKVRQNDRAKVIGKAGKNIKILNRFVRRLFGMEEVRVK